MPVEPSRVLSVARAPTPQSSSLLPLALHTLHWLVNDVELDDLETAKSPPRTEWKAAIQRASQSTVLRWLQDVASGRHVVAGGAHLLQYADFYKDYVGFHPGLLKRRL